MRYLIGISIFLSLLFQQSASALCITAEMGEWGCTPWYVYPCECNFLWGHGAIPPNAQSLIVDNILTSKIELRLLLIYGPQSPHPLHFDYEHRLFPNSGVNEQAIQTPWRLTFRAMENSNGTDDLYLTPMPQGIHSDAAVACGHVAIQSISQSHTLGSFESIPFEIDFHLVGLEQPSKKQESLLRKNDKDHELETRWHQVIEGCCAGSLPRHRPPRYID
jgi:hypothetical protein